MRDVFAAAATWSERGIPFALATLVDVRFAAPAPVGATMAVNADGAIAGDIGAGCYEGEIVEATMSTAADGVARTLAIDLANDDPLEAGSGCGGELDVVTWAPTAHFARDAAAIVTGRGEVCLPIAYERDGRAAVFALRVPARRTLVVVGGTTLAQELASLANRLDFRTIVVDPRPAFATTQRLSAADQIVVAWPEDALAGLLDATTPVLVISHDPKLDLPALRCALASEAPYVGLLGSRRAQGARRAALRDAGVSPEALRRIRGPVGLDLGGVTIAETALSILAEIVADARGRAAGSLSSHDGAIHNANANANANASRSLSPSAATR